MQTNYFEGCSTLQDVKELYRTLAKQHHPDRGGNLETMQAINNHGSHSLNDDPQAQNQAIKELLS